MNQSSLKPLKSRFKSIFVATFVAIASTLAADAQSKAPKAWLPAPGSSVYVTALSDNGLWGVSEKVGDLDVDNPQPVGGNLLNLSTKKMTDVPPGSTGRASVCDVTDDGNIVVGSADAVPAYWTKSTNTWTKLKLPLTYNIGQLLCVTPDGHYAVGYVGKDSDINIAAPVMYDLTTNTQIQLPNMPTTGMNGRNYSQNCPSGVSPDGRFIVGMVAQAFLMDDGVSVMWAYVYDRETNTAKPIGFTKSASGKFTSIVDGGNFIDFVRMSPNGQWAAGVLRLAKPIPGSTYFDDYGVAFRYNILTDEFEVYDGVTDKDIGAFAIDNNGVVYGALPWESPYPVAQVRSGRYFYSFDQVFSEIYNFSLQRAIGDDVTGRPMSVSGDGLTFSMSNSTTDTYILQLGESIAEAAKDVNLLGIYTAEPPTGSEIAKIKTVDITFDRPIQVVGDYKKIKVFKADGSTLLTALSATVASDNTNKLTVGLRTTTLTAGEKYTLTIPAGIISIAGDNSVKNKQIDINYTGRANEAVKAIEMYPANNSHVSRIDASSNPVVIVYDSKIKLADNAPEVLLYEVGVPLPRSSFSANVVDNMLYLYPLSTQYLFEDIDYIIEIPAGIVTDLSSSGASEALSITYHGTYIREVNSDETYIFKADGGTDTYLQFIPFDGDLLIPAATPESWGFTQATPWWGVMSSDTSGDIAFASHSMYTPAGKSDDWMMTPQLYIPDENVYLSFDVQGYLKSKTDRLKVYVYVSDDGFNSLNASLAEEIRANGDLIYDKVVDPGNTEEGLEGEWTHEIISLADYADQGIYIAFVNENEDQSAVFLDNVEVVRNVKFTTAFRHSATVVGLDNIKIEGVLTIKDELNTFSSALLTLKDSAGKTVDTISASGLSLSNGSTLPFSFEKSLPLTIGQINKFALEVVLDNEEPTIIQDAIKDLVFRPTKRVVLEEFTGSECGNCPLGILAIDNLMAKYPKNFIPITLRCYSGDFLGIGVTDYANFLGLAAAPSAQINRSGVAYSPAISADGKYFFSGEGLTTTDGSSALTWLDVVANELQTDADADIDFSVNYDSSSRSLSIPVTVRYALDSFGASVKILAVVLEDNLLTYQVNYFAGNDNPELLPWSKSGAYGQSTVIYTFDDVARGWIGQTLSGTPGLLPVEITGGEEYGATITGSLPSSITEDKVAQSKVVVMLIDDLSQRIINANIAKIGSATNGVDSVVASDDDISVVVVGNTVTATAKNEKITLQVYSVAGSLIASTVAHDSATLSIPDVKAPVIVRASTPSNSIVKKVIIK